jgi:uncharacterized membrane protein
MSLSIDVQQHYAPSEEQARKHVGLIKAAGDMALIWLATAGMMVLSHLEPIGILAAIRLLLALPVLFFFPGYALSVALFARRGQLGWIERLGLSIVFSLAMTVFCGLALYATNIAIDRFSLLIALALLSALWSIASVARRIALPSDEVFIPPFALLAGRQARAIGGRSRFTLAAIITLVALNFSAVAYALLAAGPAEYYTEFSALNPESGKSDIQAALAERDHYGLTVTVGNRENRTRSYELRISGDNGYTASIPIAMLDPGASWKREVQIPLHLSQPLGHVQLDLFADHEPAKPYRELHIWVHTAMEQRQQ